MLTRELRGQQVGLARQKSKETTRYRFLNGIGSSNEDEEKAANMKIEPMGYKGTNKLGIKLHEHILKSLH